MENSLCNIPSKILKTIIATSILGGKRYIFRSMFGQREMLK